MKYSILLMTFAISTMAFAQNRTTREHRPPGGGPDVTSLDVSGFKDAADSAESTVDLVKYNMQLCNQNKSAIYEASHIKDVFTLVQALQFANTLEGWKTLKYTNYRNETCETGNHDYISPDVRCMLTGTEEALNHFVLQKDAVEYLMKANVKKEDAVVMVEYLKEINSIMIDERLSNPSKYHFKLNKTILKGLKKKQEIDN